MQYVGPGKPSIIEFQGTSMVANEWSVDKVMRGYSVPDLTNQGWRGLDAEIAEIHNTRKMVVEPYSAMDNFHIEKLEANGVAYADDAKNVILRMADRIRQLEADLISSKEEK
jgi:hypothetical protein